MTMIGQNVFDDMPILAKLSPRQAAQALREVGETDIALALEQSPSATVKRPDNFGLFDIFKSKPKPWMHAAHAFGFLPLKSKKGREKQILAAGRIAADESLKNARIRITLNRLRVAAFPGGGRHTILFDFYAQNQVAQGTEDVHFNSTFRVEEGSQAGIIGYPVFLGLGVGTTGVAFRCYTVNVKNDEDEKFLSMLESTVFKKGLQLATVAQPALAPLSELAVGITKGIASRNRNIPVQEFFMGLDFGGAKMGARLAQGDYIAVQIPMELQTVWNWDDWEFDESSGQILNADDGSNIPFNYIVFGVTKYDGQ